MRVREKGVVITIAKRQVLELIKDNRDAFRRDRLMPILQRVHEELRNTVFERSKENNEKMAKVKWGIVQSYAFHYLSHPFLILSVKCPNAKFHNPHLKHSTIESVMLLQVVYQRCEFVFEVFSFNNSVNKAMRK